MIRPIQHMAKTHRVQEEHFPKKVNENAKKIEKLAHESISHVATQIAAGTTRLERTKEWESNHDVTKSGKSLNVKVKVFQP